MRLRKLAQTATEYLIILAVVIIIALIVVGVLGGIPGIGGTSKGNVADAYWRTSTIGVDGQNFIAGSTGNDKIILRNNLPTDVLIYNITIDGLTISNHTLLNITILAGRSQEVSLDQFDGVTSNAEIEDKFGVCDGLQAGDDFTVPVVVTYLDKESNAVYTFTGAENLEGECSSA